MANEFIARNGLIAQNNSIVTGSLTVTQGITGSLFGTSSWSQNSISSLAASSASYLNTLNQNLIFNGNLTLNGTASIAYLNVSYESASVIFSSGSNQLGDDITDTQLLIGTTKISGSLQLTGSANLPSITGSLFGTSSWAQNSLTASYILNAVSASYAVTASYLAGSVDSLGVSPVVVVVATTTTLPSTPVYGNGTLGVGAFLSGSVNGAIGSIDGVTLTLSDRILVKNQTSQLQNGVYEVTQTGSAAAKYILTRTADSDQTAEFDPQVVIPSLGTTNKGLLFAQTTDNPIIGTSAIVYTQTTTTTYVTQTTTGTQTLYTIPWWTATARQLSKGVTNLQYNSVTNTLVVTGSVIATSFTGSVFGTASWASNATSSSYALSSSYAPNTTFPYTGSAIISGSLRVTGSIESTSFTGSLFGTASWSTNAVTASYILQSVSASFATSSSYSLSSVSSSYAATASFSNTLGASIGQNAAGSIQLKNSSNVVLSTINIGVITASLAYTASLAVTASNANTASYVLNAVSSSFATSASFGLTSISASFAATASSVNILNQNVIVNGAVTASYMILSGSGGNVNRLRVVGSGSNTPIFTIQGSQGELFSISDSLSGSLFSVNDISGLPILEVFSDNTTLIGSYTARSLITTAKNVISSTGQFTVYSIPTSSYDGAFYEYTLKQGSNARAGHISAVWIGSGVNFTETTTMDFGDTSQIDLGVFISGSNMVLTGSASTSGWTMKTIVRAI